LGFDLLKDLAFEKKYKTHLYIVGHVDMWVGLHHSGYLAFLL